MINPRLKIGGALTALAFLAGVIVAASADSSVDYNSGPIWIGSATPLPTRPTVEVASADAGFAPSLPDPTMTAVAGKADGAPQSIVPPLVAPTTPVAAPAASAPVIAPAGGDKPDADKAPTADSKPAGATPTPAAAPAAPSDSAKAPPAPVTGDDKAGDVAKVQPAPPPAQSDADKPSDVAQNLLGGPKFIAPPKAPIPTLNPVAPRNVQVTPPGVTTPSGSTPAVAPGGTPPATPASVTFTGTSGKDLSIEINRGALVRLQTPADTVFVANPDVADIQVKSPRLIYVFGKRAGETVLYAVDANDNLLLNTRIVVSHNLQALRTAINSVVPNGGVSIVSAGDALVLDGNVGSASQVEDIRRLAVRFAPGDGAVVNNLHVLAPNQVNLRVRVAEVSRDTLKQFGINWQNAIKLGGFVFGLAQGAKVIDDSGGSNNGKIIVNNNGTNSIVGSFRNSHVDLNTVIDALANENLITVLAEPNLTAMSGETANFLAGGEFPIPVAQSGSNAGAISVEFKKFGVSLSFTPTVVDGSRINLRVRPEVSQLSTVGSVTLNGNTIPALTTRNAETTVELASGQSFAIAGLLQHNSQQDASKTPFLGDVPILGALFKSDRYQRNETELVIVVTPYLVKPVSANAVATPVDGLTPPTDMQRIFYGTKNQQKLPEAGNAPRGRDGNTVIGPAGFQLD